MSLGATAGMVLGWPSALCQPKEFRVDRDVMPDYWLQFPCSAIERTSFAQWGRHRNGS